MGRAELLCLSDRVQLLLDPNREQRVVLVSSTTFVIDLQFTPETAFVQTKLARQSMTQVTFKNQAYFYLVSDYIL